MATYGEACPPQLNARTPLLRLTVLSLLFQLIIFDRECLRVAGYNRYS